MFVVGLRQIILRVCGNGWGNWLIPARLMLCAGCASLSDPANRKKAESVSND